MPRGVLGFGLLGRSWQINRDGVCSGHGPAAPCARCQRDALGFRRNLQLRIIEVGLQVCHSIAGEFRVTVDGRSIASAEITGTESRRMGVFRRVEGSYSTTLQVPIGRRTVRVRVTSSDGSFDESREVSAEFVEGQEKTLTATCDSRRSSLSLSLR